MGKLVQITADCLTILVTFCGLCVALWHNDGITAGWAGVALFAMIRLVVRDIYECLSVRRVR